MALIVGLPRIARRLAEEWGCRTVTQYAVALFAVGHQLPLAMRAVGKRREGIVEEEALCAWATRQQALVEQAGVRGPRSDRHLIVRMLRDVRVVDGKGAEKAGSIPSPFPAEKSPETEKGSDEMALVIVTSSDKDKVPGVATTVAEPLSGFTAIRDYVARRRPAAVETVKKWARRRRDPLPVERFGTGAKAVARPEAVDAWLERERRRAERAAG